MTRPVVYRREAQLEFDEAFDWYEGRRAGLGGEFAGAVQQTIDRIIANPERHGLVHSDVRCALVRRFPYGVYYQTEEQRIVVVAVFHSSRDPKVWQSRSEN
jgi:toxin ParE1/3/4